MTTKLNRAGTYNEEGELIYDVTWHSHQEVTWQMRNKFSTIVKGLWPPKLAGQRFIMSRTHPWCHTILWPRGGMRSRDKLKTKCLLLCKVDDHKTWCQVVNYNERNSPRMSDNSLITWSCKVTWQNENLLSLPPQGLWLPKMGGSGLIVREIHLSSHMIL